MADNNNNNNIEIDYETKKLERKKERNRKYYISHPKAFPCKFCDNTFLSKLGFERHNISKKHLKKLDELKRLNEFYDRIAKMDKLENI